MAMTASRRARPKGDTGPHLRAPRFMSPHNEASQPRNLLTASEQAALTARASLVIYPARTSIYAAGDDAQYLYIIDQGLVRISVALSNGERQILGFMWPGDILGLAEEGRYANSADCLTRTALYRISLADLRRLLVDEPLLQLQFLTKAAHELRRAQRLIIVLGRLDNAKRLAAFLLDCRQHLADSDDKPDQMHLPMTRFDIADYLGMSPESVARAFTVLEQRGLVRRVTARTLGILGADKLRRFSQMVLET